MTIALGIVTGDSLIVAADTEESDGFLKTNQRKIALASNILSYTHRGRARKPKGKAQAEVATIAVAGAGNAGYIDTVTPFLVEDFQVAHDSDADTLLEELSKTIRKFYLSHVVPFALYPERERPELSVLIGITRKGERDNLLFASEKTTLRRCEPYQAVGVGASFATLLLKRLWPQVWVDKKTAALLAAFIMYHVKESVEYCGKFTDVLVLSDGKQTPLPQDLSRQMEQLFRRYSRLEGDALHAIFSMSPDHQEQSVANVARLFTALRGEITALAAKWSLS